MLRYTNPEETEPLSQRFDWQFHTLEEKRNITKNEWPLAHELGEPFRTRYEATQIYEPEAVNSGKPAPGGRVYELPADDEEIRGRREELDEAIKEDRPTP